EHPAVVEAAPPGRRRHVPPGPPMLGGAGPPGPPILGELAPVSPRPPILGESSVERLTRPRSRLPPQLRGARTTLPGARVPPRTGRSGCRCAAAAPARPGSPQDGGVRGDGRPPRRRRAV